MQQRVYTVHAHDMYMHMHMYMCMYMHMCMYMQPGYIHVHVMLYVDQWSRL